MALIDFSGQSLRERDVVNEDRISELADDLIIQILTSVPTKNVIATSVLSKRWRSLWKWVPKLDLNIDNKESAVGRFLTLHEAPVLESLDLTVTGICDEKDVEQWVRTALARNVHDFRLHLCVPMKSVTLPISLLCSDTLVTLTLSSSIYVDVPSPVSMKSLRILHLQFVTYKDDESIRNLFSGCPNLEDLVLRRYNPKCGINFNIVAPMLKKLSIYNCSDGRQGGYVINAPSLKYLFIERLQGCEFFVVENARMLVKANIRDVSDMVNEDILESLKSAKRLLLEFSPLEVKCPIGAVFYQLVYLEITTCKAEWWNLLTFMLDHSPKLQFLKLRHCNENQHDHIKGWFGGKFSEPKNIPECLLSHLETFVWDIHVWRSEEQKKVAKYILRTGRHLKKATLSTSRLKSKERLEILNEINGVVRASDSCHLVFE